MKNAVSSAYAKTCETRAAIADFWLYFTVAIQNSAGTKAQGITTDVVWNLLESFFPMPICAPVLS